jgi:hypothetical protein
MEAGVVEHKVGLATVKANDPRPLEQALTAVSEEHGWIVDYEDPPYTIAPDLVDDTSPQWRVSHPDSPGVTIPAGGAFQSDYDEGAAIATLKGQGAALRKIVSEYNRSGNPGKFLVREEEDGRFAVVGTTVKANAGKERNVASILDTRISLPTQQRSAAETIEAILKEVSDTSGTRLVVGTAPLNIILNSQVTVGGENLPARTLLLQTLNGTGRTLIWSLLYDADIPSYALNLRVATIASRDTYGRKSLTPIDIRRTK